MLDNLYMRFVTLATVFSEYSSHFRLNYCCFISWTVIGSDALKCDFNLKKTLKQLKIKNKCNNPVFFLDHMI